MPENDDISFILKKQNKKILYFISIQNKFKNGPILRCLCFESALCTDVDIYLMNI